jgi:hypothetical protein
VNDQNSSTNHQTLQTGYRFRLNRNGYGMLDVAAQSTFAKNRDVSSNRQRRKGRS